MGRCKGGGGKEGSFPPLRHSLFFLPIGFGEFLHSSSLEISPPPDSLISIPFYSNIGTPPISLKRPPLTTTSPLPIGDH